MLANLGAVCFWQPIPSLLNLLVAVLRERLCRVPAYGFVQLALGEWDSFPSLEECRVISHKLRIRISVYVKKTTAGSTSAIGGQCRDKVRVRV